MMRSMFSAVSGLRAHQTRMDVIGNNIANVNTAGFKGARVTFQEVFNQTLRGAGSPQAGKGGTNPQQVGLGISIASMDTFHIRGSVETTGYNTDAMINGEGFFIVADGDVRSYTRAGSFGLDEAGNLVTADGFKLLGYMYDSERQRYINSLTGLQVSKSMSFPALATSGVTFGGNLNANTQMRTGDVPVEIGTAPDNRPTTINDLGNTVARDTTFTVYDERGGTHDIRVAFVKREVAPPTPPALPTSQYEVVLINSDGTVQIPDAANRAIITFDSSGKHVSGGLQITVNPSNGASPFDFSVDFSKLTDFANESDASAEHVTGYKQGSLSDFAIDANGVITGYFSNGQMRPIGQMMLANFSNPSGLQKTGSNLYRVTSNSGEPLMGQPGTGGRGSLNPGALEMSNVDLSREFTNMITTQRGFQANSRVITASDEMLQEVVNMKR
ncbi:flagellar hook protein FlgE [Serpentinicella alkaliphila]|uniref:Flagellar hook protein FlgE n=1 Tax=Serpentinicella alkaliphila TaxID=1734049 RepID=A0A4R2UDP4_9FIRM|nr:flagellar hook protein FlgE [Serpentinicella alkaliphila]QUH26283.1 flagellar hook protein FlgE [Serpentinicella alkaliphila]TCQ05863.1 flagellar hook protein FlgE [Serpentinicella alkaliphila]